jgi:hypothetical protein
VGAAGEHRGRRRDPGPRSAQYSGWVRSGPAPVSGRKATVTTKTDRLALRLDPIGRIRKPRRRECAPGGGVSVTLSWRFCDCLSRSSLLASPLLGSSPALGIVRAPGGPCRCGVRSRPCRCEFGSPSSAAILAAVRLHVRVAVFRGEFQSSSGCTFGPPSSVASSSRRPVARSGRRLPWRVPVVVFRCGFESSSVALRVPAQAFRSASFHEEEEACYEEGPTSSRA